MFKAQAGAAEFGTPQLVYTFGSSVELHDMDGNGFLDLLFLSPFGRGIHWLANAGGFIDNSTVNYLNKYFGQVAVGDFDLDGKTDVALPGAPNASSVNVLYTSAKGFIRETLPPTHLVSNTHLVETVAAIRQTPQGSSNLLAVLRPSALSVLVQNGTQLPATIEPDVALQHDLAALLTLDLDRNGVDDVLFADRRTKSLLLATAALGRFNRETVPVGACPATPDLLVLHDTDGDDGMMMMEC